ncbi:allantoinase AllB [Paenibacillus sp. sptzw28]|uniref:allantoinase AllB n=1 Tax=Paenibacillus sp. sptzw28 TaxID=715179 RepID=UPI001C6ED50B|nr:allantoinase AllB [Paenibacillus sp. sptzw28]QYR19829.1 allantoinase AllB [Paenibacillus sp. sptzw28]
MRTDYDLIVTNGTVVLQEGAVKLDIGITDGRISALSPRLDSNARMKYDAAGMTVMPGGIDVHVHLNEPGMGHWEGFRTGSAALAAGGTTTYFDMPLNGRPPTVTAQTFNLKTQLASGQSSVDYALWGGLMPGFLDKLEEMAEAGAIGFKAFMSSPGMMEEGDFRESDDATLKKGMEIIARTGGILALHAESEPMVAELAAAARAAGKTGSYDYCASRPVAAEVEAVKRALSFAEAAGCRLHFVHISSAEAAEAIAEARRRGVDVTAETCTHYLLLTEDDLPVIGPAAKCSPPLRSRAEVERLWGSLLSGALGMVSSDHSPCPEAMKESADFFEAWGGIAGAQHRMELLIDEAHLKRGIPLPLVADWLSGQPAARFGLDDRKGRIEIGLEADLVLVDMNSAYEVEQHSLYQLHKHSPFIGRTIGCQVQATFCRGELVYEKKSGVPERREGMFLAASGKMTGAKKVNG